jgi:hypothetical protein
MAAVRPFAVQAGCRRTSTCRRLLCRCADGALGDRLAGGSRARPEPEGAGIRSVPSRACREFAVLPQRGDVGNTGAGRGDAWLWIAGLRGHLTRARSRSAAPADTTTPPGRMARWCSTNAAIRMPDSKGIAATAPASRRASAQGDVLWLPSRDGVVALDHARHRPANPMRRRWSSSACARPLAGSRLGAASMRACTCPRRRGTWASNSPR